MSFVFYDTETTGTNTAFDQILQFGAIRTNYELNEIDRFEIRCRLLPYVVPAPGAMRVTGVTAGQLVDPSLPTHYQMVRAIRAKLTEWSPAIFIGHNSLGFDEHLLRQAFYKTLHAPYLTNTNGNCRTDSLRMIQAVARFAPDALNITVDNRGKQLFKLDRLAPANGFDHSAAHDAMADVEATIHMCRLIAEREPEHWSRFVRFAQKAAVTDFALEEDVFVLTDFYYARPYSWMVTAIGTNPENGSEMFVLDLSNDPDDLAVLDDEDLAGVLAQSPKPVRGMRTNAGPIVMPYEDAPEDMRDAWPALDELRRRAARVKGDAALCERLIVARLASREERKPSEHVEEQIYDGFTTHDDNALMDQFHSLEWTQRVPVIGRLADGRLRALGQRLLYVEAPELMDDVARLDYDAAIARRLMAADGTKPWLTYPQALAEIEDMIAVAQGDDAGLLAGHRNYLLERAAWAGTLLD
ncbi:exonuclease domain-containing protein [Albidovulum sediminicola]|uniref:Exonuclease domain-containing protein n=1 Tax=Albidovulum sediminicola TaxID=2984331 RepID=A0ABT2YZV0_9RHOB|nr:exonuclease domain-containing protein [Defluviimonas sp. WL0075]MCV2864404.1 exonuclease domain-containing protein [Defluviimonas sp. WL0075]